LRVGLAAGALLAALSTGCLHADARDDPGTIVFQSDRSGRWAAYAVRPDGAELGKVAELPDAGSEQMVWAPDGSRVLVVGHTFRGDASFVLEPSSGRRRPVQISMRAAEHVPAWSPDGNHLALAGDGGLVILDAETGARRRLTRSWRDGAPTWSPDGEKILYVSGQGVYTIPADGGLPTGVAVLTHLQPFAPAWSPNGEWISFRASGFVGGQQRLEVARPDGTKRRTLAREAETYAWSPDGRTVAYNVGDAVYRISIDGRDPVKLVDDAFSFSWSPDGRHLVYVYPFSSQADRLPQPGLQIWTMRADGSDKRPITRSFPDGGSNDLPNWVAGRVKAAPRPPDPPLVSFPRVKSIETAQPVVSLDANGGRVAAIPGFGTSEAFQGPLGPIVTWNPVSGETTRTPIAGCARARDVLLVERGLAYRCDNSATDYIGHAVKFVRPGGRAEEVVEAEGTNFGGSLLGGMAADGRVMAFDVGSGIRPVYGGFRKRVTRLWTAAGQRRSLVRTFRGAATVADVDSGRIAVLRGQRAVLVLRRDGRLVRSFGFGRNGVRDAALDGRRLFVVLRGRLAAYDLRSGRREGTWPIRRRFGPPPLFAGASGDVAVYVVGLGIHILRLSGGGELMVRLPNAAAPVVARLTSAGLFYSFTDTRARGPATIAFVPMRELERALAAKADSQ
jgi:Tol biopolymer transport system component